MVYLLKYLHMCVVFISIFIFFTFYFVGLLHGILLFSDHRHLRWRMCMACSQWTQLLVLHLVLTVTLSTILRWANELSAIRNKNFNAKGRKRKGINITLHSSTSKINSVSYNENASCTAVGRLSVLPIANLSFLIKIIPFPIDPFTVDA